MRTDQNKTLPINIKDKICSCGQKSPTIPTTAKTNGLGYWWQCTCDSTQFIPHDMLPQYIQDQSLKTPSLPKPLATLAFALLFTSCSMTAKQWGQIAQGSAQIYTQTEYQNAKTLNSSYNVQYRAPSSQVSPNSNQACDLECRYQKHQLKQQLLYFQMQNDELKRQGY